MRASCESQSSPFPIVRIEPRAEAALYARELELRYRVLRAPLGMSRAEVPGPLEPRAQHWVLMQDGDVVGCVLFVAESPACGRLLQMAVDPSMERRGAGRALVLALERDVFLLGTRTITLHARRSAEGFYGRLGYIPRGTEFIEVGLPHIEMAKVLSA